MGTQTKPAVQDGDRLAWLPLERLEEAAECLKVLAHPHRLRIVEMLLSGTFTVGELAEACGVASHVASEHLRLMQRCGLLSSRREGKRVYYEVAQPHLHGLWRCIADRFGREERSVE